MIKNIEYLLRKNLGNYEHSEIKVSASVEEKECPVLAAKELMVFCHEALNGKGEFASNVEVKDPNQTEMKLPKEVEKKKELPKVEKPEEKKEETKKEKPKAEEKAEKSNRKPETKANKKISNATVYDRNLDTHKAVLSSFLDKEYPTWKSSDNLKKASAASKSLVGKPFLDENGDLLDSFKQEFLNMMA